MRCHTHSELEDTFFHLQRKYEVVFTSFVFREARKWLHLSPVEIFRQICLLSECSIIVETSQVQLNSLWEIFLRSSKEFLDQTQLRSSPSLSSDRLCRGLHSCGGSQASAWDTLLKCLILQVSTLPTNKFTVVGSLLPHWFLPCCFIFKNHNFKFPFLFHHQMGEFS